MSTLRLEELTLQLLLEQQTPHLQLVRLRHLPRQWQAHYITGNQPGDFSEIM